MLGRLSAFAAGILIWGVGRGFGLPARWAGTLARPELAAGSLAAGLCLLAALLVCTARTGGPAAGRWTAGARWSAAAQWTAWPQAWPGTTLSALRRRQLSIGSWWLVAGFAWAALSGAVGTGDAWRQAGAPEAVWRVRWTEIAPAGSVRPWHGVALARDGTAVRGRVQFWPPAQCAGERWLPGDIAELPARLTWPEGPHNPGQADARVGLATAGLSGRLQVRTAAWCDAEPLVRGRWRPAAWAEAGRRAVWRVLERELGRDWAGFAGGLLLGRSDQVPERWRDAFRESGALHLMAVSGTHLSLVVSPLWPFARRRGWWLPLLAGLAYVWLSGASSSAVRAGMLLLLTLALRRRLPGRRQAASVPPAARLQPWAAAALLTIAWDPLACFRPALQLSLAASAGICLWADRWQAALTSRWGGGKLAAYAAEGLGAGLAAQTAVLPLSFALFGGFAPAGFASSLVLIPVTGLALHGLLIGLPVALLAPGLGGLALAGPALLLRALAGLALAVAQLPLGFIWWPAGGMAALAVAGLYGAASGLWRWPGRQLTAAIAAAGIVWHVSLPTVLPDAVPPAPAFGPDVSLTFLDVGQGDAIVIRAPDGTVTLVDGGGSLEWGDGGGPDPGRTVLVPYLRWAGIPAIDRLIVTHAHADHVGGLIAVLEHVPVREVIEPGEPEALGGEPPGPAYAQFRAAVAAAGISRRIVAAGERLDLGGGLQATVLGPPQPPLRGTRSDVNANSLVLHLRYGHWQALLAGDMEAPSEDAVLASGADVDVHLLKVAHHGSNYSTQPHWLQATSPHVAVISAGRRNPFGHPGSETLARLAAHGACTLRTDTGGAVTVMTDGRRWQARTFHGGRSCTEWPQTVGPGAVASGPVF